MPTLSDNKLNQINRLEHRLQKLRLYLSIFVFLVVIGAMGGLDYLALLVGNQVGENIENKRLALKMNDNEVKDGIHLSSGLVAKGDYTLVLQNCISCHSSKLITQNRMTERSWRTTIKWMQKTQNLWDLGVSEDKIVAYLGKWYAPVNSGRRKPLEIKEWYAID